MIEEDEVRAIRDWVREYGDRWPRSLVTTKDLRALLLAIDDRDAEIKRLRAALEKP